MGFPVHDLHNEWNKKKNNTTRPCGANRIRWSANLPGKCLSLTSVACTHPRMQRSEHIDRTFISAHTHTSNHSWPKPTVSSTAIVSFCCKSLKLSYSGKSKRLKLCLVSVNFVPCDSNILLETYQVCDFGNEVLLVVAFSMVNLLGPSLPCKSLNPLTGIREVPVANCRSRDFCSASHPLMHLVYVSKSYLKALEASCLHSRNAG